MGQCSSWIPKKYIYSYNSMITRVKVSLTCFFLPLPNEMFELSRWRNHLWTCFQTKWNLRTVPNHWKHLSSSDMCVLVNYIYVWMNRIIIIAPEEASKPFVRLNFTQFWCNTNHFSVAFGFAWVCKENPTASVHCSHTHTHTHNIHGKM